MWKKIVSLFGPQARIEREFVEENRRFFMRPLEPQIDDFIRALLPVLRRHRTDQFTYGWNLWYMDYSHSVTVKKHNPSDRELASETIDHEYLDQRIFDRMIADGVIEQLRIEGTEADATEGERVFRYLKPL